MFKRILVPLDGSSLAESALPHAATVAAAFGAEVLLLRVIPVRQRSGAAPMDIIDRRLCQAEAGAYLDAVAADRPIRGLSVETQVCQGQPAEQIVETVSRRMVDLIVLTTHGMGGCTTFPVSGTAHKVISRSPASVVMVPATEPGDGWAGGYRRILVGMDGSRRGEWAVGPAAALARHAAAELVLVHVVQVPETIEEPASAELRAAAEELVRLNSRAAATHLAETQERLQSADLRVRTRLEASANVPQTLAAIAEHEKADLVVLTAHGASLSTERPYGGMAIQILHDAKRPVLIAQDSARRIDAPAKWSASGRKTTYNHQ